MGDPSLLHNLQSLENVGIVFVFLKFQVLFEWKEKGEEHFLSLSSRELSLVMRSGKLMASSVPRAEALPC